MKKPTTISKKSVSEYREFVQLRLRKRVLEAIEVVLEEEVDQALGCRSYEPAEDRRGYRNGAETRRVTTSVGTRELRVPRARVRDEETGETTEFRSELLPRYARRTREVDEAILGTYLSGANSRRIRKALKPLLGEEHLSKSAVRYSSQRGIVMVLSIWRLEHGTAPNIMGLAQDVVTHFDVNRVPQFGSA